MTAAKATSGRSSDHWMHRQKQLMLQSVFETAANAPNQTIMLTTIRIASRLATAAKPRLRVES
jgi:hypothetical protein